MIYAKISYELILQKKFTESIIIYNSEIWYMEDYYYIYKAENRSKVHGSNCDKLSFVDRFSFEKLHHKFCKAVLGIKKTSWFF